MTEEELTIATILLNKIRATRLVDYEKHGYNVLKMSDQEIYELDDGDNLIQGIDYVLDALNRWNS